MPSRALVTGGGRGIGADIARELAGDGWHVTVTGRTPEQVEAVAAEIGGAAVVGDVSKREDVERMVAAADPVDLLVANAGVGLREETAGRPTSTSGGASSRRTCSASTSAAARSSRACSSAAAGRIVITGSGASYLPGASATAYTASKAAACRYGETLANALDGRIPVFVISPGLVRTEMTEGWFSDDAPWTPPELAPRLVARARVRPLRRALGPLHPRRARPVDELEAADRPDPRRGSERDPPAPRGLMLYRPDDFEPVTEDWDEAGVRAAIARIVADADEAYRRQPLWPPPADSPVAPGKPEPSLFAGAPGLAWALDALQRRGHAETTLDPAAVALEALEAWRASAGGLPRLRGPAAARVVAALGRGGRPPRRVDADRAARARRRPPRRACGPTSTRTRSTS